MVFLGIAFIFFKSSTIKIALLAIIFSFAIEFSQLYQAEWINMIRSTRLGGLILGFGFLWTDLVCYIVGVGIEVMIDLMGFEIGVRR